MAWHSNYWSCSKFADRIRGTAKPHALGLDEWDEWTEAAKKAHPFRYWLADTALNKLQDIVYFPRHNLRKDRRLPRQPLRGENPLSDFGFEEGPLV
jgi:hypothetical protein